MLCIIDLCSLFYQAGAPQHVILIFQYTFEFMYPSFFIFNPYELTGLIRVQYVTRVMKTELCAISRNENNNNQSEVGNIEKESQMPSVHDCSQQIQCPNGIVFTLCILLNEHNDIQQQGSE